MAYEAVQQLYSAPAAADLSAKQFYAVEFDTNGNIALATAGKNMDGVLQNKPTSGQAAEIALDGISKVTLSGTVTAGQLLQVDSGSTFTVLSGGTAVAKALEGGASGQLIAARLLRSNAAYS